MYMYIYNYIYVYIYNYICNLGTDPKSAAQGHVPISYHLVLCIDLGREILKEKSWLSKTTSHVET